MAFTSALIQRMVVDGGLWEFWSYVSGGGSTGGTITTQLKLIVFAKIIEKDAAAMAALATITSTLPAGGSVTIKTTANKSGYVWLIASPC